MAIAFVTAASGEGTGTASAGPHVLTAPSALVAGNIVVLIVSFNSAVTVTSAPTDFTLQRTITDGTTLTTLVYWKLLVANEPSWTITFSGACRIGHHAVQYSGVNPTAPFKIENGVAEPGTVTAHISPSIIVTGPPTCWLISSCSVRNTSTSSFTGTDTERLDHPGSGTDAISMGTYDTDTTVVAATYAKTITSSVSNAIGTTWIGALFGTPDTVPVWDSEGIQGLSGVSRAPAQPAFGVGSKTTGQIWPQ